MPAAGGYYDENVNIWENDIQGLCSMIQDYITQYTYYEMINMEQLQKELKVQMADQMQSYLALLLVVLVIGMFLAVTITKSITEPLQQLRGRRTARPREPECEGRERADWKRSTCWHWAV